MPRYRRLFLVFLVLLAAAVSIRFTSQSQVQVPAGLRAQRDTWTPLMDVLKEKRPRVTDEQLERLKKVSIETVWGGIQGKGYRHCFVTHLKQTQPGVKMAGRALTMRYLPQRPDLDEGVRQLAKEGDWDPAFNVRGGEDAKSGDVVVVELGGMVDRATFMGTMTGLGMKLRGVRGIVVDGGIRDLNEFLGWKDFPVYYAGAHASAMADQIGVEWNIPIRVGNVTVLPGDVVIGDEEGLLFFPPQLAEEALKAAEAQTLVEDFKAEMMKSGKYRTRDIYPRLSPELQQAFEEWKKKR
ncbi:MAG: RraA family protein [Blastocatellia bacterium]